METAMSQCCNNSEIKLGNSNTPAAKLEQNNPNPFSENTSIRYFVPTSARKAEIKLFTLQGVEINNFTITERGLGKVEITENSLTSGTYLYTLIIDGNQIDSKYMTLTK